MAVNPGQAGQVYLPYVGKKVEKLLALREECKFDVYWDGACTADKIRTYGPKGVKGFVLGTGLLFGHKETYMELIKKVREI
jgi:ribulose-phosphate 3-epimerase